ncbi:MAG: hypothetical protein IT169_10055, partial [Bryobacterales bacterium]|nr:hypothetical protein [Bryobacterales bacterium]
MTPGSGGAPIAVSVTPTAVPLGPSGTQTFTATVSGASNQSVTWSVWSGQGAVSTGGVYTAPASIPSASTAKVRATSVADPSKYGEATVTLNPPSGPSITGFAPVNQTGSDATFSMLAQGGGSPVDAVQVTMDDTFDGVGGCQVWYQQSDGRLYLGGNGN